MSSDGDFKVVMLGSSGVGKSRIVDRYYNGRWSESNLPATIGIAFVSNKVSVGGKDYVMGLWDTAGSERFESMSRLYYRQTQAAIVCFDPCTGETFEKAKSWVEELQASEKGCTVYLNATKHDMVSTSGNIREVSTADIMNYVNEKQLKYFETSSKTGHGIDDLFTDVCETCVEKVKSNVTTTPGVDLVGTGDTQGKCC